MTRRNFIELAGLLGAAALVAAIWIFVLWPVLTRSDAQPGVPGPEVTVLDVPWTTLVLPGNAGHSDEAVIAMFTPGDGVDPKAVDYTSLLLELCAGVMDNLDGFAPGHVVAADINHVDLNVVVSGDPVYPFDVTVFVSDGKCRDSGIVDTFHRNENKLSNHGSSAEVMSVVMSWGLQVGAPKFVTSSSAGRYIDVDFHRHPALARSLDTMRAIDLCVLALASLSKDTSILVTTIDATQYDRLKMNIVQSSRHGFFGYTTGLGSAEMGIIDGKCDGASE